MYWQYLMSIPHGCWVVPLRRVPQHSRAPKPNGAAPRVQPGIVRYMGIKLAWPLSVSSTGASWRAPSACRGGQAHIRRLANFLRFQVWTLTWYMVYGGKTRIPPHFQPLPISSVFGWGLKYMVPQFVYGIWWVYEVFELGVHTKAQCFDLLSLRPVLWPGAPKRGSCIHACFRQTFSYRITILCVKPGITKTNKRSGRKQRSLICQCRRNHIAQRVQVLNL